MASIKITYTICHCPKCGKKLFKDVAGSISIGSPLMKCRKCGTISRTRMRTEWYNYPNKKYIYIIPLIIVAIFALTGFALGYFVFEEAVLWGIYMTVLGLIVGICMFANYAVKILLSKRRMRKADYLQMLLSAGEITPNDFLYFFSKIQ